jgi:hypothetical protein
MNTLDTIKTTDELNEIIERLVADGHIPEYCSRTSKVYYHKGHKSLSAITSDGRHWSVQVSSAVATVYNLPLWKDLPL